MADVVAAPAYLNPALSITERVDDLCARMTLQQKASQLVDNCSAIPELQIPAYSWWNEALHGVTSAGLATVFPQAIGLAATFDVDLMATVANAIGREARVKNELAQKQGRGGQPFHGLSFYSPNINIFRDPRWGRGQETYGEDPHLTAQMGVAFIRGMQGRHPTYMQVGTTAKHFAVHSGPERGRHSFDARANPHDLEDTYLPAFRAAVVDAKVAAVMTAYNRVNGVPACANESLLRDRLQHDWGFDGQIVSDCDGVRHIAEQHHFAPTTVDAYALAIRAGMTSVLDFIYGSDYSNILHAVESGLISVRLIDEALKTNMRIRFRLGMFDPHERVPYRQIPASELDSTLHRKIALDAACQSIVLLKNNGVLPLSNRRLALIGPLADNVRVLLGSYHGTPSRVTTVLDGMVSIFGPTTIVHEPGTSFLVDPKIVPNEALTTIEGARGLLAEFFIGPDLSGSPLATTIVNTVDYDGTPSMRPKNVPANSPVRWRGFLTTDLTGDFDLGLSGNSTRLFLDGTLLIDDSGPHAPRATLARVALKAGKRYRIVIEILPGLEQHVRLIWLPVPPNPLQRALAITEGADAIIAVVGITAELENEEIKTDVPGFAGGDRVSLNLPAIEEDLLKALKATGKPLVAVLMSGGPLSSPWLAEHADAILQCWYPGEEGGAAVAQSLAGINNPSGRLPVTIYRSVEDLPPFDDYDMRHRTYRYFNGEPLYAFGHGLSYTSFTYSDVILSSNIITAGGDLVVKVTVANTGNRDGGEVSQLYLRFPAVPGAPRHALRGFRRSFLVAGASASVEFTLNARDLSYVDPVGNRQVAPGSYCVIIGGGQPNGQSPTIEASFVVRGHHALPK